MKAKEKDERKGLLSTEDYILLAAFAIVVALSTFEMESLQVQLTQANLTIAQEHSQILNLTHSLAQANATAQALRSSLSQEQATINMQKAQITNLANLINLNVSETLFDNYITIPPVQNITLCGIYGCNPYYQAGNFSISFNIPHAGYLVFNTTNPMEVFIIVEEQYNSTYNIPMNVKYLSLSTSRMVYATFTDTFLNATINSQAVSVLPGQVKVLVYNYNTTPFYGYLSIKYVS